MFNTGKKTAFFKVYVKNHKKKLLILTAMLCGTISLQLVSPQITRYFIDTSLSHKSLEGLFATAAGFIMLALINQFLSVHATVATENLGWITTNELRSNLMTHCLHLDISFHKERTSGELIERVEGDVNALANFFSEFIILFVGNLLLLLGILVLLFLENWKIGVIFTIFSLVSFFIFQCLRRLAAPKWELLRDSNSNFYGFLSECLVGTEDIKANGSTLYVMKRFHNYLKTWLAAQLKAVISADLMWIVSVFLVGSATVIAFLMSYLFWKGGIISLGTIYMLLHYTDMLTGPIEKLRSQFENLQKADASISRIQSLLATSSQLTDGTLSIRKSDPITLRYEHVFFQYDGESDVIKDISFQLEPGKKLGLIGHTGSGKSTIAKLLLRLYDPREGSIYINNIDIRSLQISDLRRSIGFVTQEVQLFHGTVRDNIALFDDHITNQRIEDILYEIGMGTWLTQLSEGLNTMIESGSKGLSSGEAQLIALARVFLSDPGIIILDEASSRLDAATEAHLEFALKKLLYNRTAIIIAHKLQIMKFADDIMVLEDGVVKEFGNRYDLQSNENSRFYELLNKSEIRGLL